MRGRPWPLCSGAMRPLTVVSRGHSRARKPVLTGDLLPECELRIARGWSKRRSTEAWPVKTGLSNCLAELLTEPPETASLSPLGSSSSRPRDHSAKRRGSPTAKCTEPRASCIFGAVKARESRDGGARLGSGTEVADLIKAKPGAQSSVTERESLTQSSP